MGVPGALAILVSLPSSTLAAELSYSYLELTADVSKTENTAVAPLEEDAEGHLFGIAGSWEVFDSLYLKGAWSREVKDFRNEVARTPVDLDSRQTVLGLIYMTPPTPVARLPLVSSAFGAIPLIELSKPGVAHHRHGPLLVGCPFPGLLLGLHGLSPWSPGPFFPPFFSSIPCRRCVSGANCPPSYP